MNVKRRFPNHDVIWKIDILSMFVIRQPFGGKNTLILGHVEINAIISQDFIFSHLLNKTRKVLIVGQVFILIH